MTERPKWIKTFDPDAYDTSAIATPILNGAFRLWMDGTHFTGMDGAWLKAELERPGRSQSALARFLGVAPETVNRICSGKRQLKAAEADKIRAYLVATHSGGAATPHLSNPPVLTSYLQVKGTVEAGSWREVPFSDVLEPEIIPAPKSMVDAGGFALRVSGPSMNQKYPEGSYVVVMPWHGGPLPIGKRVVVERQRPDGLIETTVKELVRRPDGELELWPRSNHPNHQAPVPYKDIDGVTVRLVGVVAWVVAPD